MQRTPIAKILPPSRTAAFMARPRLFDLVSTVAQRRLTTVVAEAGFGKSTLLTSWWDAVPCAWYTTDERDQDLVAFGRQLSEALRLRVPDLPVDVSALAEGTAGPEPDQASRADSLGARLAELLHECLQADVLLILDDVHELAPSGPSARLVEALCRHAPPLLHVVLAGRSGPPFSVGRLRGRGHLLEIGGDQLAFTPAETAELVASQLSATDPGLAADVHRLAGGWPAAVVMAIEALRGADHTEHRRLLAGLEDPEAPLFSYLAEEVFTRQPERVRSLVARLALLDDFTPDLCSALELSGVGAALGDLARRGLFIERRQDGTMSLRPLVRDFALEHLALPAATQREVRTSAADWLESHGDAAGALRILLAMDDPTRLAALLERLGERLLLGGNVAAVLKACGSLPSTVRTPRIEQLEGEAQQVHGDWGAALACFQRAAGGSDDLPAGLAWRMGVIQYLRGEPEQALATYRRGFSGPAESPVDAALLLAWAATAHWVRGDVDECRSLATRALDAATSCGDSRALAAAHTVMAMLAALDGDRRANDAHYLLALRAAEDARDVLQMVRIRTNRASHFMEEGSYPEALQELEVAVRLAELTSFASFLALSLSNRGEIKFRTGRLDEAMADLEASRDRYQQIGSEMIAYPLTVIADVYRERGNLALARTFFEDAMRITERSGDQQGLVPALAGLSTVIAVEDPSAARALAERGVACGTGMGYVAALLAAGWVSAAAGDAASAGEYGRRAAATARERHDRAGLAEALALEATSGGTDALDANRLRQSASIWRDIGCPVAAARAELALAAAERGTASVVLRRHAEQQLEALGLHGRTGSTVAAGLAMVAEQHQPPARRIQSLGGFAVVRDGQPIRLSEWQSRKARELLKLLVARRGRPAGRSYLMETLWPDEDSERVANRLSVALTTVRAVLESRRTAGAEDLLLADKDSVALNLNAVDVDLEWFLQAAAEGLEYVRRGDTGRGLPVLESAVRAYTGDFLEENAYDDWAVPPREEARAAFVAVARTVAQHAASRGDPDAAVPHFLRILEVDRYDEPANLGLVGALSDAGRHGEAHRYYLNYRRAMDELGVEPAPFPEARQPVTAFSGP